MLDLSAFTGEVGGLLSVAFAMGAVAGWGFAQRTAVKLANERIAELKLDLQKAVERISHLEDQRFEMAIGPKGNGKC